jgi:lipid A disaccharide synthetase
MDEFVGLDSSRLEQGGVTAEYAIAILAAAGFAGVLLAILQSDQVRNWLVGIVERALSL